MLSEGREYFRRDRVTAGFYGGFMAWGWYIFGITPILPVLADELGASLALAALHGSAGAVGTFGAGFTSSLIARKLGRFKQMILGLTLLTCGVTTLIFAPGIYLTLPAMALGTCGGNMLLSGAQTGLTAYHRLWGPRAISEGNALTTLFGLISPLVIGISMNLGFGWRPALAIAIVFTTSTAVLLTRSRHAISSVDMRLTDTGALRLKKAQPTHPVFWLTWAAFLCGVGVENSTVMFSGQFINTETNMGAGMATASISLLIAGMTLSRFLSGRLAGHIMPQIIHASCFAIILLGWFIFWPAFNTATTLIGLVILGFGMGGLYPMGISILLRLLPGRIDFAQGISVLGVGIATATMPLALGTLTDLTSIRTAFFIVPTFTLLALIFLGSAALYMRKHPNPR